MSSEIDPAGFESLIEAAGFRCMLRREYALPNGKALVRLDFAGTEA